MKIHQKAIRPLFHPELDTSEILEGDMSAKYLTIVGQLQWLVTLGRFDIHAQVATISRFRATPRQRHTDRLKRIYSYAIRTKDYAINLSFSFYLTKNLIGDTLYMVMSTKSFLMTCQIHLARQ